MRPAAPRDTLIPAGAAISSLRQPFHLIAGGLRKGARPEDFAPMTAAMAGALVKAVYLIGSTAAVLAEAIGALPSPPTVVQAGTLEVRRGACGTMPACEVADLHVALWARVEAGDWRGARGLLNKMLPLLNMESMYSISVYKEVLKRRGVIQNTYIRGAGHPTLDEHDHQELTAILEDLEPLFHKPLSGTPGAGFHAR